jgi:uncharacterized protein YbjT (DUF2867 family)
MKIIIVGAAGLVGAKIVDLLGREGHDVSACRGGQA